MKRKTSTVPTKIITYGCLAPTEGAERFHDQLYLAHKYQNTLIEIELDCRRQYREARALLPDMQPLDAEYAELTAQIDDLRASVKAARAAARARIPTPDLTLRIKALREQRKAVGVKRKEAREVAKADPGLAEAVARIQAEKTARVKAARAECGVYWGTYLMREQAMEQAAKNPKADPTFRRYDRSGKIGVQLQHGVTLAELHGCEDTRLQLTPLPANQWDTRSGRRRAYSTVRIRIGSDGRAPIWATFPVLLHRPLPADARIMWAWILVRRVGTDTTYQLQLAVESEGYAARGQGTGTVAVDIGWKADPEGIAVALAVDEQGQQRSLVLPGIVRARLEHADKLRSIADRNFDAARADLTAWLAGREQVPEWLAEATQYLHAWRSSKRLATLAVGWRTHLESADQSELDMVARLEAWRRQNRHLYQWGSRERAKALRRRKDIYRQWVAGLQRDYARVVIEDVDYRQLARNAAPEADASGDYVHRTRVIAAPSELRDALREVFGAGSVAKLAPAGRAIEGVGEDYAKCWLLLRDAGCDVTAVERVWRENAERIREMARRRSAA